MKTLTTTCTNCEATADLDQAVHDGWLFCTVRTPDRKVPDGHVGLCAGCKPKLTGEDVYNLGVADSEASLADWVHREAMSALGWPEASA